MAEGDIIQYLTSLKAVRERSQVVFGAAKAGSLSNFVYHADKLPEAADFVMSVIEVLISYPVRWSHIPQLTIS